MGLFKRTFHKDERGINWEIFEPSINRGGVDIFYFNKPDEVFARKFIKKRRKR